MLSSGNRPGTYHWRSSELGFHYSTSSGHSSVRCVELGLHYRSQRLFLVILNIHEAAEQHVVRGPDIASNLFNNSHFHSVLQKRLCPQAH